MLFLRDVIPHTPLTDARDQVRQLSNLPLGAPIRTALRSGWPPSYRFSLPKHRRFACTAVVLMVSRPLVRWEGNNYPGGIKMPQPSLRTYIRASSLEVRRPCLILQFSLSFLPFFYFFLGQLPVATVGHLRFI